ncbi:MAG: SPASM domain-containing protein, partial [Acidobacteria bacterium]|nr:SPASM domain-containing protein [Acidobacteriota bacterium]
PVFPCRVGSLDRDTLDGLMDSGLMRALRDRDGIGGRCAGCPAFRMCGGGCRAVVYVMSGDANAPDPFCWVEDTHD